jgi:tetratricopeptide (TPR) repeat protein
MHRLVHSVIRAWVSQSGREETARAAALEHISAIFPSSDYMNREIWREYLPHALRVAEDERRSQSYTTSELYLNVGNCLYVDGRINEALLWLEESCKWRDAHLHEGDPERLSSQRSLARAYLANGYIEKAVELLERSVTISAKALGKEHPLQLASQHELARAYHANGRIKESIDLLEYVAAMKAKIFNEEHPSRLASEYGLARVYQDNGQLWEAVTLLEHIVSIEAKCLSQDHPDRLASQRELARAYHTNGQVREAVDLLQHVVSVEAKCLSQDHPDRLASQRELARAYHNNGQASEAVDLLEHVILIEAKLLSEDHPGRLASQRELARAYHTNGQVREAVDLLEHVVSIEAHVLSEDHPSRLASQHELIRIYRANAQVKEADILLQRVISASNTREYTGMIDRDTSDLISILSADMPPSLTSGSTISDTPISSSTAQEVAEMLLTNITLQPLFSAAFEMVGREKFKRNLFRLIKKFAVGLRAEAITANQQRAAGLITSRANYVVYLIMQRMKVTEELPSIPQATIPWSERQLYIEKFLEQQVERSESPQASWSIGTVFEPGDSNLEAFQVPIQHPSDGEEDLGEPGRKILINLKKLKRFIIESKALQKLKEDLTRFTLSNGTSERPTMIDDTAKHQHAVFGTICARMTCFYDWMSKVFKYNEQGLAPGSCRVKWSCVSSAAATYGKANK